VAGRVADLRQVADERVAARAADLHDVGQRVLRLLAGIQQGAPELPGEPVILVAEDLAPSDTARLDPRRILGICTVMGGPTAHTAIIARSLGIPAVVGAGAEILEYPEGATAVLDGAAGRLYLDPGADALASARSFQDELRRRRERDLETRYQPAILTDGCRVEIAANISRTAEAARAVEAGAEGVGLMRTEFLFLDRDTAPDEDEQYEAYATMVRALDGRSLILRTLDIGGDKVVPYLSLPQEANPFLGVRGIRLCLRHPELFLPQLRAIYRASALGPVKIMLPMVATIEELRSARAFAERVRREIGAAPVEIGIMIEVPAAALMAPELAKEADFFSIGTNDLTQYILAMDRTHPVLAPHADGLHPAVLRAVNLTIRAAKAAGRWVGVCGGIAGDPVGALIFTGLGVQELSMSLPSIAAVKAAMRRYSLAQAQAFARRALACATADEVRALPLP
jgi:phosphocarrier protein FPr